MYQNMPASLANKKPAQSWLAISILYFVIEITRDYVLCPKLLVSFT